MPSRYLVPLSLFPRLLEWNRISRPIEMTQYKFAIVGVFRPAKIVGVDDPSN